MRNVTITIPMITVDGPLQHRQVSRDFQGVIPENDSVAFVARIVREGLETAQYPEYKRLIALPDDWIVQQIELVTSVPNDVWIRNGFYPFSEWQPSLD
jgi:hypothetical protein